MGADLDLIMQCLLYCTGLIMGGSIHSSAPPPVQFSSVPRVNMAAGDEKRDYDVIVFGASGFTGQFVTEELCRQQSDGGNSLKWAAAGRNEAKVRDTLQCTHVHPVVHIVLFMIPLSLSLLLILHAASGIEGVDVIAADVADQDSLENMCAKATVVINCVGPVSL